jgi:hypothetical protein
VDEGFRRDHTRSPGEFYRISFLAAFSVFFISIAIVIGPTPPGTGVIADATFIAEGK